MGINRIATKMQADGMSTKDIIKQLHGNLGNIKEAASILIADAKAAKFNETITSHQQSVVSAYEKNQGANREAITMLSQDRRSTDAANNLNANNDQITAAMQAAADKRKKFIGELKALIGTINTAQTDIATMLTNSNASSADIKAALSKHMVAINDSLKKREPEVAIIFESDKAVLTSSRKLATQIRETAHTYSILLPEAETPRQTK